MRITLLITSSIAAYKTPELIRELKKRSHSVRVALSTGAKEFVTPLTLQTVSGEPVATELFDLEEESRIGHISLADKCDALLVAPATANFLAKAAHGIADDLPTTVLLATKAPIFIAPAMNVNMWENQATQENLATLERRGAQIIEPDSGELACGWEGKGRLAEISRIISAVESISTSGDLTGKAVVVTAGPTREALDPIRFITNRSSGKMGIAIAEEAKRRGAEVHILCGPGVKAPSGITSYQFESAIDLNNLLPKVISTLAKETTLFMAAAPGDFRAPEVATSKLKDDKSKELLLRLVANPDILQNLSANRSGLPSLKTVVAFCAESLSGEELIANAREKLKRKGADFIVANNIAESFAGDTTKIALLARAHPNVTSTATVTKQEAARWLIDQIKLASSATSPAKR